MDWLGDEIYSVDGKSASDVWERFLAAMDAYWNESFPAEISHSEWHELYSHQIRLRLEKHPTWLWMYERHGRTLALTNFHLEGGVAHIAEVWVAPESRRHGLGKFMVGEMKRVLRDAGIGRMAVTVPSSATDSLDFWRSMGFGDVAVQLERSTFVLDRS
jgi:ribosomal protein S18 acetylase RimI-like enzyme